jgi:uncharacterized membrane protein
VSALPHTALKHPISRRLHEERTFGERLADNVAEAVGSWRFLIVQTILVMVWIAVNVVGLVRGWDPYPFVLLNLLFSVQAAYTGPVLLLSSNRAAQRDRIMAEHDHVTNEKAEQLVESLMSELLRNSQATLAIAEHLEVHQQALSQHGASLDAKFTDVQNQLAEVEDVLADQASAAPSRESETAPLDAQLVPGETSRVSR